MPPFGIPPFDRYLFRLRLEKTPPFPFYHGAVLHVLSNAALGVSELPPGLTYLGYLFCRSMVMESEKKKETLQEGDIGAEIRLEDLPRISWLTPVPLSSIRRLPSPGKKPEPGPEIVQLSESPPEGYERSPLYLTSPAIHIELKGNASRLETRYLTAGSCPASTKTNATHTSTTPGKPVEEFTVIKTAYRYRKVLCPHRTRGRNSLATVALLISLCGNACKSPTEPESETLSRRVEPTTNDPRYPNGSLVITADFCACLGSGVPAYLDGVQIVPSLSCSETRVLVVPPGTHTFSVGGGARMPYTSVVVDSKWASVLRIQCPI